MTLGFIEWVLFLGMVGLIWMMLDLFGDDHYTVDKRQGSASPNHRNNRRRQPVQPSHASPASAGSHGCHAVDEVAASVLRSLAKEGVLPAFIAEATSVE